MYKKKIYLTYIMRTYRTLGLGIYKLRISELIISGSGKSFLEFRDVGIKIYFNLGPD